MINIEYPFKHTHLTASLYVLRCLQIFRAIIHDPEYLKRHLHVKASFIQSIKSSTISGFNKKSCWTESNLQFYGLTYFVQFLKLILLGIIFIDITQISNFISILINSTREICIYKLYRRKFKYAFKNFKHIKCYFAHLFV